MKVINWKELDEAGQKQALARPRPLHEAEQSALIHDICKGVKERRDEALREYGKKFDKTQATEIKVSQAEIVNSLSVIDISLRAAMEKAISNIMAFHEAERPEQKRVETMPGVVCELHWRAIDTVGLYVPGGSAPLFSTLIMQAIPSFIAGCSRRIVCTPPQADGKVHPAILAAAHLCGITEVFAVGGAQAIAAMAYGTETIPKVDKITGPGNMFVTEAKQHVAADPDGAAIDMPAGPSEVMVIAENSPRPDWIAADLLAQAEHDPSAQAILVTIDPKLPERVIEQIETRIATLPRKAIAEKSMEQGRIIIAPDMRTAIEIANRYAPEHLILHNEDCAKWLSEVKHAGSVFLGPWTPESAGDYASGTNHVLPTNGYARSYSGLSVISYMKSMTVQRITREAIKSIGGIIVTLARGEQLEAHALATSERITGK